MLEIRRNATKGLFHLQLSRVQGVTFYWYTRTGEDGGKSYRQKRTKCQNLLLLLIDCLELQLVRFKWFFGTIINWELVAI